MEVSTPEEAAKDILTKLRMNGLWEPAGLGLSYMKVGENQLKLVEQHNNPTSAQARIRMKILLNGIDWEIDESEVNLIDVQHMTPPEQHIPT